MADKQAEYAHEGGKGDPELARAGAAEASTHQQAQARASYGLDVSMQAARASAALGWEGGFAAKADELANSGVDVGTPTTHQYPLLTDPAGAWLVVRQNSTAGVMEWSSGAPPLFIPGV
jgi:hypothetical protein